MANENIFAAPQAEVKDLAGGSGLFSDSLVTSLRKTRPWVLFLAILGFISAAFILIASVPMLLGAGMMGESMVEGMGAVGSARGMFIGMGIFYIVLALITILASIYLLKFSSAIKRAVDSLNPSDLDDAMEMQAKFWRLVGILSLISIVLSLVMMVGVVFMGMNMS